MDGACGGMCDGTTTPALFSWEKEVQERERERKEGLFSRCGVAITNASRAMENAAKQKAGLGQETGHQSNLHLPADTKHPIAIVTPPCAHTPTWLSTPHLVFIGNEDSVTKHTFSLFMSTTDQPTNTSGEVRLTRSARFACQPARHCACLLLIVIVAAVSRLSETANATELLYQGSCRQIQHPGIL